MQLLLLKQIVVHGNSATATSAGTCTGNSATATKLKTARNIALSGTIKGNANFDGSGNIEIKTTQNNIAIITGTLKLSANSEEQALNNHCTYTDTKISYPEGFSADNCVVISYGRQHNSNFGYAYGWDNYLDSMDFLIGILPMRINLYGNSSTEYANKIRLQMGNMTTKEVEIPYKIVLLKI